MTFMFPKTIRLVLLLSLSLMGQGVIATEMQAVTLQLNWKHQFEFAAFYAAKEQGYYREVGLEVKIIEGGVSFNVRRL